MYKDKPRKKTDINNNITNLFSGSSNKYANAHVNFLEHLYKELEARKMKSARTLYRKQLVENRNKENYYNEIHRIKGILSQNDTRLPIGTRERLKERVEHIKKLKYDAFDNLADIRDDIK